MSFWFGNAQEYAGPTSRAWTQFQLMDLDGDGKIDQVLLDNRGLQVAWGLGAGAFGQTSLFLPARGVPLGFVLEDASSNDVHSPFQRGGDGAAHLVRFFLLERDPSVVRVGEVNGRSWKELEEWDAQGAWQIQKSPFGVVIGPDDQGVILLDKDRVQKRLKGSVLPGARIRVDDWDGDGTGDVMLEHPETRALGVVWGGLEQWGEVSWLPGTAGTVNWVTMHRGSRPPGLLRMDGQSGTLSLCSWTDRGGWQARALDGLGGHKQFWSLDSPHWENCIFLYRQVMHSLVIFQLEADSVVDTWNLTEWPQIHNLQLADWEGDGDLDLVGELDDAKFFVQPWLGRVDDRAMSGVNRPVVQIWDLPLVRKGQLKSVPFPLDVPAFWASGLPPECSSGPSEWALHDGELLIAVEDGVLERIPLSTLSRSLSDLRKSEKKPDASSPEWKTCLGVEYLRFHQEDVWPCLAYIEPQKWYEVTYVRRKDLTTEVWLNGSLVYQGSSDALRYKHRSLTTGSPPNANRRNRTMVVLDDIRVSREVMPLDQTPAWIAKGQDPVAYVAGVAEELRYNFEGNQPLKSEYFDFNWELLPGAFLTKGYEGSGIATGSESGFAYGGIGEYTDEVVLSFRFNWKGSPADIFRQSEDLLSLHGMFNIGFTLKPGMVRDGGYIRGPESMDSRWMGELGGLGIFHAHGAWGGIGSRGELWVQSGASWEAPDLVGALPRGERQASPWVWKGQIQALFGDEPILYTLDVRERRWTREGAVHPWLQGVDRIIQAGDWLYWMHSGEGRSGWLNLATQKVHLATPDEGPWDPRWVGGFARDGAVVLFDTEGEERELWPPLGEVARGGEDFRVLSCWYNASFLMVLLTMLGLLAWRIRRTRRGKHKGILQEVEGEMESDWGGIGSEEKERLGLAAMQMLLDWEGQTLDTQSFDSAIGIDSIETDETRRSRRSRFILIVNDWSQRACGEDAVVRQQDPTDRRRVLYWVSLRVARHLRQLNAENPMLN